MRLSECLEKYKQLTVIALDRINNDEIEDIHILIEERQDVIEKMKSIEYTMIEFKSMCEEYCIIEYDEKLRKEIDKKKIEVKLKMQENINHQNMKNKYNTAATRAIFLAREV